MGYDRAVRWIENNPGQHSVEEIGEAVGFDMSRRAPRENLGNYLRRSTRRGDIEKVKGEPTTGGRHRVYYRRREE